MPTYRVSANAVCHDFKFGARVDVRVEREGPPTSPEAERLAIAEGVARLLRSLPTMLPEDIDMEVSGVEIVEEPPVPPSPLAANSDEAALLAGVCATPNDDTPRLVYADWLDERGGDADAARAAFIRAQIELARPAAAGDAARRRALRAEVRRLHKQFAAEWIASVHAVAPPPRGWESPGLECWTRGFLSHLTVQSVADWRAAAPVLLGFCPVESLYVQRFTEADVVTLAGVPENTRLRELHLSAGIDEAFQFGDDGATALAASPHFSGLEHLDVIQNRVTTRGVEWIANSPSLARLTKLELYGNPVDDETYRVLAGTRLATRMTEWWVDGSGEVTSAAARVLAESPHLGHVTGISFSNTNVGDDGIAALAAAEHFAGLRYLNLRNLLGTGFTRNGVRAIARSPVFANLREIDLQKTWIDGIGAKYLRDSPFLKKIRVLALYSAVPEASEAKLTARFGKRVDFGRR